MGILRTAREILQRKYIGFIPLSCNESIAIMKLISLIRQRGPVCLWYKFKNTYLKPDKDIREIGARNGSYEYLKRFAKECNSSVANMQPGEKIIWVCWLQGIE